MSRNTYKDVSNANRTKCNTKRRQENSIHWRYLKDHDKKSVSISSDHYQSQMGWMR